MVRKKHTWHRLRNWAILTGPDTTSNNLILRRREHARRVFWRLWRFAPGGFSEPGPHWDS